MACMGILLYLVEQKPPQLATLSSEWSQMLCVKWAAGHHSGQHTEQGTVWRVPVGHRQVFDLSHQGCCNVPGSELLRSGR